MDCDFSTSVCPRCGFDIRSIGGDATWRRNCVSRGLGDTVARVLDAVGVAKCGGCAKRQKLLNQLVPYSG
jgi:hypothetical protein